MSTTHLQSTLPATMRPMLAQLARRPFDSPEHLFELKWDGIRALAFVEGRRLCLRNRRGEDITAHFPELGGLPGGVLRDRVVLDGELVCLDDHGRANLQYLRERLGQPEARLSRKNTVHFIAFDVLFVGGEPLLRAPLVSRKNALHQLLVPSPQVQATDFVETDGKAFFDATCRLGLEGIVAKEKMAPYEPGRRGRSWQKVKRIREAEFIIGGYTFGGNEREPFSALLLGLLNEYGKLLYVGQLSSGLSDRLKGELFGRLRTLHVPACPFSTQPRIPKFIHWCRPDLVCTVQYGEFTEDRQLAYPVFMALETEKTAGECVVSEAMGWPVKLADFA